MNSATGPAVQGSEPPWVHVRREPFDYGLLPLPSLMHNDGVPALRQLRSEIFAKAVASPSPDPASPSSSSASYSPASPRIKLSDIASALGLTEGQAHLVLDALASVLPADALDEPSGQVPSTEVDSPGANIDYLIIFLFIQVYRRVPHRPHKDATVLADVWPQPPSPFDNYPPASNNMAQIKSTSIAKQRSMPGQAEEEAHQLAFVQKNLPSLLGLLAEDVDSGDDDDSKKVITGDKLDYLGLLLRAGGLGSDEVCLSQVTPFFANSDPAMPAAPAPLPQVLDWLLKHICGASDHMRGGGGAGAGSGPSSPVSGLALPVPAPAAGSGSGAGAGAGTGGASDITMSDAPPAQGGASQILGTAGGVGAGAGVGVGGGLSLINGTGGVSSPVAKDWRPAGMTCVDGYTKMSVLKQEHDIEGGNIRRQVASPDGVGVGDWDVGGGVGVFGGTGRGGGAQAVKVELCERVQLIVACARIKIANCRECTFYLGTNQSPLVIGDNHNLQVPAPLQPIHASGCICICICLPACLPRVAPFNTFYPKLDAHLALTGINPAVNRWDTLVTLGVVDPHDAMSHPAGVADAQAEGATLLSPDRFVPFVVRARAPSRVAEMLANAGVQTTVINACEAAGEECVLLLASSIRPESTKTVEGLRQTLKTAVLEENKKKELTNVIQAHFKEWLFASGNIRQVYDLARLDRD
eukprot:jgi/Mesen1/2744/ME000169S01914